MRGNFRENSDRFVQIERLKIQQNIKQMQIEAQAKERADRIREQEILLERERHQVGFSHYFELIYFGKFVRIDTMKI